MSDRFEQAKYLVRAAHGYAITVYRPLSEQFPEICEVPKSGLIDYWDYFITIASVGFAFMEIADSFKADRDIDNAADGIKKALNEWEIRERQYIHTEELLQFYIPGQQLIQSCIIPGIQIG